jgi:hypothetical protein
VIRAFHKFFKKSLLLKRLSALKANPLGHCARSQVVAISAMHRPSALGVGRRSGGQCSHPRIALRI